jgi:hypothetical protein
MRRLLLIPFGLLLGCGDASTSLRPQADADQPKLDTTTHTEPERIWESGLTMRDISWHYNFATQLRNSISVIGSFRLTLVNRNVERNIDAGVIVRLIAPDGERHVAETPITQISVPADTLVSLRANFIIEVHDESAANDIERMEISLF